MASTMVRVPSTSDIPVALRSSDGPSALMTASAPRTACPTASRSVSSPEIAVSAGWLMPSLAGLQT